MGSVLITTAGGGVAALGGDGGKDTGGDISMVMCSLSTIAAVAASAMSTDADADAGEEAEPEPEDEDDFWTLRLS